MTRKRWHKPALWVLLAAIVIGAAVGGLLYVRHRQNEPKAIAGADLTGGKPGDLISAMTMSDLPGDGQDYSSARVVYRSTEGDTDKQTIVSGSVFVPKGDPPDGGWPVIAVAHSTTGINEPCAPSLSPNLLGSGTQVLDFVAIGYAVAVPDYQGLGSPGIHPYLDARTAGLNLIDAVRALRATFPDISTRWAAFGGSQGGGAAWAADEQQASYAPELDLVGAVALAPASDVTGLVDRSLAGTLTSDQAPAVQYIVETLARLHPEINRDDYRHGSVARNWDVLSACSGPLVKQRDAAVAEIGPLDLAPVSRMAADKERYLLRQWSLPQKKLSAPLIVVYGGKDSFIDPAWTNGSLIRACVLGGTITRDYQPDKGHADLDRTKAFSWLLDRFRGKPVVDDCKAVSG